MITEAAIEKAKAHGWAPQMPGQPWQSTAFDKAFWQAVIVDTEHQPKAWLPLAMLFCESVVTGVNMERFWKEELKPLKR